MIFLEVDPSPKQRQQIERLLDGLKPMALPMDAAEFLQYLQSQDLEVEERVRQYLSDARDLLETRPVVAWRRAQQAVSLLGHRPDLPNAVRDRALRAEAQLTLARVALNLLGQPATGLPSQDQLRHTAREATAEAGRADIVKLLDAVAAYQRASAERQPELLLELLGLLGVSADLEPWVRFSLRPWYPEWLKKLEALAARPGFCEAVCTALPGYYEALGLSRQEALLRTKRTRLSAAEALLARRHYHKALQVVYLAAPPPPTILARCYEGLGRHGKAAALFEEAGDFKAALRNHREDGNLDGAVRMLGLLRDHPDREMILWLQQFKDLVGRHPMGAKQQFTAAEWTMLMEALRQAGLLFVSGPSQVVPPRFPDLEQMFFDEDEDEDEDEMDEDGSY